MKLFTDQEIQNHLNGIQEALDDKKALDIVTVDVSERSSIADYFVVCSGNSNTHTKALSHAVNSYAKDNELSLSSLEGSKDSSWILVDLGFIIVHIMQEKQRRFYNLEQLWSQDGIGETA